MEILSPSEFILNLGHLHHFKSIKGGWEGSGYPSPLTKLYEIHMGQIFPNKSHQFAPFLNKYFPPRNVATINCR